MDITISVYPDYINVIFYCWGQIDASLCGSIELGWTSQYFAKLLVVR